VCNLFVCLIAFLFLCTVTDFSAAEEARGVKFCTRIGLLSGQVFSPFGELWLAGSHGGITFRMNAHSEYTDEQCTFLETNTEASGNARWAFGIGASCKAVWWNLRLASQLTVDALCSDMQHILDIDVTF